MTKALYDITRHFNDNPGWFSRRELGRALCRAGWKLRADDIEALDKLVDDGVIEVRRDGLQKRFEYRKVVARITER